MEAHDLARILLAGPNLSVIIHTINGFEEVENITTEPDGMMVAVSAQSNTENIDFSSGSEDEIKYHYKLIPTNHDEGSSVVLMSKSFGCN